MIQTDVTKTRMHKIMNYDKVSAELATIRADNERLREAGDNLRGFVRLFSGGDEVIHLAISEWDKAKDALK